MRLDARSVSISITVVAADGCVRQEMLVGSCRFRISSIPDTPDSGTMTLTCIVVSSLNIFSRGMPSFTSSLTTLATVALLA